VLTLKLTAGQIIVLGDVKMLTFKWPGQIFKFYCTVYEKHEYHLNMNKVMK